MGSWGDKVGESDAFADVYEHFYDQYDNGATPEIATQSVRDELADYLADYDDQFDAHFALALAQWETQSLEPSLLKMVGQYIESGADLKNWEQRSAEPKVLKKRAAALSLFLKKLSSPRPSKKRRKRPKLDFRTDKLVELAAPDGKKTFEVAEEFSDGEYNHTGAMMTWSSGGGGSVFYFRKPGVKVIARWLDSHNLEVTIEKGIEFSKKEDWAFFCGDKINVYYKSA